MEEKSVQKSPIGIIYQATPHLSQRAHVSTCRVVSQMRSQEYLNSRVCK